MSIIPLLLPRTRLASIHAGALKPWTEHPTPPPPPPPLFPGHPSPSPEKKKHEDEEPSCSIPPDISSLVSTIKSLCSSNRHSEAFNVFSILLRLRSTISHLLLLQPISSLLSSSVALKSRSSGRQLHAKAATLGLAAHPSLVSSLVSFYIASGQLPDAWRIVESSTFSDALAWNLLISSCLRNGKPSESLLAYKMMIRKGVEPDSFTYTSVLSACGQSLDLGFGVGVHSSIDGRKDGIGTNLFVVNALMGMYAKCDDLNSARKLFDEMPERDSVSWNSMISGYASKGKWEQAFQLFRKMREDGSPDAATVNSVTWNTIANGHLRVGNHHDALRLISQMMASGSKFDFVTLVIALNASSRLGSIRVGKEIHGFTVRRNCNELENLSNALITMYSRCGSTKQAYVLFRLASNQSLVTWNSMVSGFANEHRMEEASMVFQDMVSSGFRPNYVTIVTILALCARVANLRHGSELHCHVIKHDEYGSYRLLWNALVDLYSKSGRISLARRVFDQMSDRDGISYTSIMAGYGMQGEGLKALELFDAMVSQGIKPDHISIVTALSACSHSGLVDQGRALFNKMDAFYGVRPQMEHYSCMVDLFSRSGRLLEAKEMLERSPASTPAMWAALLCACHVQGNTEIGEGVARTLLEMNTRNAGHYVLVANMYAASGSWQMLARVRTMMRDNGVKKMPGWAWVDLGLGFQPFMVEDRSSPLSLAIYEVLETLYEQMEVENALVAAEVLDFYAEMVEREM